MLNLTRTAKLIGIGLLSIGAFKVAQIALKSHAAKSANNVVLQNEIVSTTVQPSVKADVTSTFLPNRTETAKSSLQYLTLPPSRTIILFGEVGMNALPVAAEISRLAETSNEPIYLLLSGPGGSVSMGMRVIAAMQASKAPVYTICDILCASMDAMIHQFGKKRYVTSHSIMMFHPAAGGAEGDVDRMYSLIAFMKGYVGGIEHDIADRQGITFAEYKAKTQTNLWLDDVQSLEQHVSDGTVAYYLPDLASSLGAPSGDNNSSKRKFGTLDIRWYCDECVAKGLEWLTYKQP